MRESGMSEEQVSAATSYYNTDDAEVLRAREQYKKFYDEYKGEVLKEKEEVIAAGGLRIIGTERHESRRIDNQLRGRAGRQGDVGSSVFYLSMEDELVRLFGGDRMKRIAEMFKIDEDTPFSMGMLTRQIENAQRNIEGQNYTTRRQVLEYDNVMNVQRTIIYGERNKVLDGINAHDQILKMMRDQVDKLVAAYTDERVDWDEWDYETLNKEIERRILPGEEDFLTQERMEKWALDEIKEQLYEAVRSAYEDKIAEADALGKEANAPIDFSEIERVIMLRVIDSKWMDHIDSMDQLRKGIVLKAYGNQDPVAAYKKAGLEMFEDMTAKMEEEIVSLLMHVNVERAPRREEQKIEMVTNRNGGAAPVAKAVKAGSVGRNDPCPCGSGKKYKECCMGKEQNR